MWGRVREGGGGAQTSSHAPRLATPTPNPSPQGGGENKGLQPPPDNSFDRRADFSAAHRARKSTVQGFDEAPQRGYVARTPVDINAELRKSLGYDESDPTKTLIGEMPEERDEISDISEPRREKRHRPTPQPITLGVTARCRRWRSCCARAGAEFAEQDGAGKVWTPHRPPRPEKSEGGQQLVIKSDFDPKGDQPTAIRDLVEGIKRNDRNQVLLGVTGSGKTFTMAKVIEATQRPALILAPNKTLAAQLYGEFRSFFPDNAVEYFVSYYDYYQPEAYVPRTDTYIEKESSINEQIDRMRHSATRALLERDDVIIVASVSCIYGIGSVETYSAMTFSIKQRRAHRPAPADRRPGGAAIQAHRRRFLPRLVPRARRHRRHLPGALRGPRLAGERCSATKWNRSTSSIRSPARRPTSWNSSRSTPIRTTSRRGRR